MFEYHYGFRIRQEFAGICGLVSVDWPVIRNFEDREHWIRSNIKIRTKKATLPREWWLYKTPSSQKGEELTINY